LPVLQLLLGAFGLDLAETMLAPWRSGARWPANPARVLTPSTDPGHDAVLGRRDCNPRLDRVGLGGHASAAAGTFS